MGTAASSALGAGPGWGPEGPAPAVGERCERVRAALAAAQYGDEGISRTLGVSQLSALRERRLPALRRRTGGGRPLDTLIRMFLLGQAVEEAEFARALGGSQLEDWAELGLIESADGAVHPTVQLRCYQELVVAYDFVRFGAGGVRPDYVMGVSPSSLVLVAMTVRREVATALDLGTGCGIQALLAARHSQRVIATDTNPRALAMARFNARFNHVANVEFREGNLFAPVAGEGFDLIVSNPPFIISPDHRHLFLNSGWEGDEVCRRIVREAPPHLKPGGYCILNANWPLIEGQDWQERLGGWFEGTGCDGLVLQQETAELDRYAATLIQATPDDSEAFRTAFEGWMAYYEQRRFRAIHGGVIAMHRVEGRAPWFAAEDGPVEFAVNAGSDIEYLMGLRSWLQNCDDRSLLEARLRLPPNVRLTQVCHVEGGEWRPDAMQVRRLGGIAFAGAIDGPGAALLARCDGIRTLKEQIAVLAEAMQGDAAGMTPAVLQRIRGLIARGFLEPGDWRGPS